jgi:methionyl-tRNA formyltransferase
MLDTLRALEEGSLEPRPQNHDLADYAPMLKRSDGHPPPSLTAPEIEGRIRGFDPWPGVWFGRRGKRIRLLEARSLAGVEEKSPAGRVLGLEEDALVMVCGGGTRLAIGAVQPEGRRAVRARDAVNGRTLLPGDDLEQLPAGQ